MNGRTVHAVVLSVFLVMASAFYLISPAVYAYFSEVEMTSQITPTRLARTTPARLTAFAFDRYNVNAPRTARFKLYLSCFLMTTDAKRIANCGHEVRPGQSVYGPFNLKLVSGRYVARFDFSGNDACGGGEAKIEVVTTGGLGRILALYEGQMPPGKHLEVPFELKMMDAALGAVEFRTFGLSRCVVLERVDWSSVDEQRS